MTGQAHAQVAIGFRSGVHISFNNLDFEDEFQSLANRDNITSLNLAIPIEFSTSTMVSFQTGLSFLSKGTRVRYTDQLQEVSFINKYALDYLQLPLTAKLTLPFNEYALYFVGGCSIDYAVDLEVLKLTYRQNGSYNIEKYKLDFERAQINQLDIGLIFGGGIMANIARGKKLFVDIRLDWGLIDIDKRKSQEIYNQGRSLTMGMLLPLTRKQ